MSQISKQVSGSIFYSEVPNEVTPAHSGSALSSPRSVESSLTSKHGQDASESQLSPNSNSQNHQEDGANPTEGDATARGILRRSAAFYAGRQHREGHAHRSGFILTDNDNKIPSWTSSSTSNSSISLRSDTDSDSECYDDTFDGWPSDEFSELEASGDEHDKDCGSKVNSREEKRKLAAMEILTTETSYVARLYTMFKTSFIIEGANRMKHFLPDNVRAQMFPCIETLYRLHNDNILPALRMRMSEWSTKPYLSDIWKEYLPYLTPYKLYMNQLNTATELIQRTRSSSVDFARLLDDIEKEEGFKKLNLQSLLLEPVQRLPRYRLLLQTYLKYLKDDANIVERQSTEDIVDALSKLAYDCEITLKNKDMFGDFQKIQDRIEDMLCVLNPRAKLLQEGACTELTSSTFKKQLHRYMFLFSDFLLICSPRRLSNKLVIRKRLDVEDMRLRPSSHQCILNHNPELLVTVKAQESVVDLLFPDQATKCSWEEMILYVICNKVIVRLQRLDIANDLVVRGNNADFQCAPIMIHDDKADSCMMCDLRFQAVIRRRHHCRGCGIVACAKCCNQRIALPYKNKDVERVCNNCFLRARRNYPELTRQLSTKRTITVKRRQFRKSDHGSADADDDGNDSEKESLTSDKHSSLDTTVSLESCPSYSDDLC